MDQSIKIREMREYDLLSALNLSVAEGWNQTRADWQFFLENPDNKCIVAEAAGKIAGTATALVHSKTIAWIGMVLVDKSHRGKGIGRSLMETVIDMLDCSMCIKLDATPAGKPLYESLGFRDEYRIIRMTADPVRDAEKGHPYNILYEAGPELLHELSIFDTEVFGTGRNKLLQYLIENAPDRLFVTRKKNVIKGFVMGRRGTRFEYTGPLNAESVEQAGELLFKALGPITGKPAVVDVAADKADFIMMLEKAGFVRQREFTRMYLNDHNISGQPSKQYLISGPEFG